MAITLADFTKIWADTSPLTPYSFSESNYKEGWNFIGGTPPARQMWDSIQKQNDEKMKYIVDNFLPLSGGTMTGDITMANGNSVANAPDYSVFADYENFTAPTINSNRLKKVNGGYKTVGNIVYVHYTFQMNVSLNKGVWTVAGGFPNPFFNGGSWSNLPLTIGTWYSDTQSGYFSNASIDSFGSLVLALDGTVDATPADSSHGIVVHGIYLKKA